MSKLCFLSLCLHAQYVKAYCSLVMHPVFLEPQVPSKTDFINKSCSNFKNSNNPQLFWILSTFKYCFVSRNMWKWCFCNFCKRASIWLNTFHSTCILSILNPKQMKQLISWKKVAPTSKVEITINFYLNPIQIFDFSYVKIVFFKFMCPCPICESILFIGHASCVFRTTSTFQNWFHKQKLIQLQKFK
jgi:hypothetical protein